MSFAALGAVLLRGAVPADVLARCQLALAHAAWVPEATTGSAFHFDTAVVALPALDAWLAGVQADWLAACGVVEEGLVFDGQLKRLGAGPGYRFPWHRDHRAGQRLGASINLSAGPVEGGLFEQRLRWERAVEVQLHSQPGDVLLFAAADPTRVHRVTPVTGATARVVWAGWFVPRSTGGSA